MIIREIPENYHRFVLFDSPADRQTKMTADQRLAKLSFLSSPDATSTGWRFLMLFSNFGRREKTLT